jgi:hypothetical protein
MAFGLSLVGFGMLGSKVLYILSGPDCALAERKSRT